MKRLIIGDILFIIVSWKSRKSIKVFLRSKLLPAEEVIIEINMFKFRCQFSLFPFVKKIYER